MPASRNPNRSMFWRIIRRLLSANRGRLFVILLALGAGAAVTAALLNLQVDAKRRLTTEFRRFGANVILAPQQPEETSGVQTLSETLLDRLPKSGAHNPISAVELLYATADVTAYDSEAIDRKRIWSGPAVIAGFRWVGQDLAQSIPYEVIEGHNVAVLDAETCEVGQKLAERVHLHVEAELEMRTQQAEVGCVVSQVRSFGATEDDQVFVALSTAQHLTGLPGRVSLLQLSVPGTPAEIESYIDLLKRTFPNVNVRPIRQFTEGEAKIYNRISGILTATVALVLILTGLCVMAAMTNVAMERRNDVGLMKAIGGATRRVLRLFLAEAALLGLAGGLLGAAIGMLLSIWLGKTVFSVAAQPRLIVYPVAVALTIIVAIGGAYPLRRLANIRPASVFRGEA